MEPLETLIKSVCCWHKNVNFYLLQSGDIDDNWIIGINEKLTKFGSCLQNLVIPEFDFTLHKFVLERESPLTKTSFYRYFIPNLIKAERVLYLDTDIIINGSLSPLFEVEMIDFPLYAAYDYALNWNTKNHFYEKFSEYEDYSLYQGGENFSPYLNSGVLLLNIPKCKEIRFTERLIYLTQKYNRVTYGDQDIINFLLFKYWIDIGIKYNYQVGAELFFSNKLYLYPTLEKPVVIHYTGSKKPWIDKYKNYSPYHQLYWTYKNKNWNDIYTNPSFLA